MLLLVKVVYTGQTEARKRRDPNEAGVPGTAHDHHIVIMMVSITDIKCTVGQEI